MPAKPNFCTQSHMAAAWMAMEHFNNRDSSVVFELETDLVRDCNVTFKLDEDEMGVGVT